MSDEIEKAKEAGAEHKDHPSVVSSIKNLLSKKEALEGAARTRPEIMNKDERNEQIARLIGVPREVVERIAREIRK